LSGPVQRPGEIEQPDAKGRSGRQVATARGDGEWRAGGVVATGCQKLVDAVEDRARFGFEQFRAVGGERFGRKFAALELREQSIQSGRIASGARSWHLCRVAERICPGR
jgi:hypothetical protein